MRGQENPPTWLGGAAFARLLAVAGLAYAVSGSLASGQQATGPGAKATSGLNAHATQASNPDAKTNAQPNTAAGPAQDSRINAKDLATRALANEAAMVSHNGMYLRYRMHKAEDKGDSVRDVIESKEGTVARLVAKDGHLLTPQEDQAELDRMNAMLAHPDDFARHQRREQAEKDRAQALLRLVPQALLFEVASPQQPLPGASAPDPVIVELNFRPNPAFKPPTFEAQILKSVEGRVWINRNELQNVRLEVSIVSDAVFGWGLLGKLYRGGSIVLDLADAGGHHWIMTHLNENLTVRALFRTINLNVKEDLSDFITLRGAMGYQDAIRVLENGSAAPANASAGVGAGRASLPPQSAATQLNPPVPSREWSRAAR